MSDKNEHLSIHSQLKITKSPVYLFPIELPSLYSIKGFSELMCMKSIRISLWKKFCIVFVL